MDQIQVAKLVSEGFDRAKNGDALEVYNQVVPIFESGSLPDKCHYGMGWIIYYALHQSPDNDIAGRKRMLANYLKLKVTVPHKQYSMILTQAIRLYKDSVNAAYGKRRDEVVKFSIIGFTRLWNLDNLRPGDWNRKTIDNKTVPSTVEKLITALTDESVALASSPDPALIALTDRALEFYPDSVTLYDQRASLHMLAGDTQEARNMLQKALMLAPTKFFLWSRMARLVGIDEDPNLHIALLYRALSAPGPEQFKGKVMLALAEAFTRLKAYGQALWNLDKLKKLYESNGWHLSPIVNKLEKEIPAGTSPVDPRPIYAKVEHLTDRMLYASLPDTIMSKTYHKMPDAKTPGRYGRPAIAWRVTAADGTNAWITPHKFGIDPTLPIGTRLAAKLFNGRIVAATPLPS